MHSEKIKVLLFDIGGVVIDYDLNRAFTAWEPISRFSRLAMQQAFKFDAVYEQHERGEITAEAYFDHLCTTLQLQQDHARIAEGWNAIFIGEIIETLAMVQAARLRFPCYAFTNTNDIHHVTWSAMFPRVTDSFERVFTSYEVGYRKPDPRVFEYVARTLGVSPESIMFFDDTVENVDAAASSGLRAVHVRAPADVRNALQSIGCELQPL
jgi:glucose-1-phosphatase